MGSFLLKLYKIRKERDIWKLLIKLRIQYNNMEVDYI